MSHALVLRSKHEKCRFGEHEKSLHKRVEKSVME